MPVVALLVAAALEEGEKIASIKNDFIVQSVEEIQRSGSLVVEHRAADLDQRKGCGSFPSIIFPLTNDEKWQHTGNICSSVGKILRLIL